MSRRSLFYHPESECFIETHTESDAREAANQGCSDVTDMTVFEAAFRQQEIQKSHLPDVNA